MAMPDIVVYRPFSVRFVIKATDKTSSLAAVMKFANVEPKPALASLVCEDWGTADIPALRYWRVKEGFVLEAVVTEDETAEQLIASIAEELKPLGWEIVGPP
jgi:hypothetical protein